MKEPMPDQHQEPMREERYDGDGAMQTQTEQVQPEQRQFDQQPQADQRQFEQQPQTDQRRFEQQPQAAGGPPPGESAGLLPWHEAEGYRRQWESIQASFVDDPRQAIERADGLVVEVLHRMAQVREEHRNRLRSGLGENSSTEDYLGTIRSYRALFEGLLQS
jgi:hypothetical protein